MEDTLPKSVVEFEKSYPAVWEAFTALGEQCHTAGGPLDEKTRRLAKLGIAIGLRHQGAVHSATRHALRAGLAPEEIRHVAVLAITTIGWPAAYAALTWIEDILGRVTEPGSTK